MRENIKIIIRKNKTVIITSVLTSVISFIVLLALLGIFAAANKSFLKDRFALFLNASGMAGDRQDKIITRDVAAEDSLIIDIVESANPAVVSIVITKDVPIIERYYENFNPFNDGFFDDFFGGDGFGFRIPQYREKGTEKKEVGGGSGFFISSDGLVVTNRHVVDDNEADYTVLTNDGEKYKAEVLAKDSILDIAILKVKGKDFPYLKFGNSDFLKPGQTVIAIGNALAEFHNSVSVGVVSGLSRSIVAGDFSGRSELLEGVIQTDAAINPGNSGGPLLDLVGNVIGINVAVQRGAENIGFALPSNTVKSIVDSVKEHGEIVRPYLGVRYIQITEDLKKRNNLPVDYGVLIIRGETIGDLAVLPGSPADKAGLLENDIILEVNGIKLDGKKSLALLIRQKKVGDEITLKILSKGREKEVKVILEKMPERM